MWASSVTIMAISSQSRPASETEAGVHHWQRTGLLDPSVIKPVIATLDVSLIIRKLGHLSDDDRTTLDRLLAAILGHSGSAELTPEKR